jgi:hypothetical protein
MTGNGFSPGIPNRLKEGIILLKAEATQKIKCRLAEIK